MWKKEINKSVLKLKTSAQQKRQKNESGKIQRFNCIHNVLFLK